MATVAQTMMKVRRILTGPLGLRVQLVGDMITVPFANASTPGQIRIMDFGKSKDGEPRSLARVMSLVVRGVPATPALYEYLVREVPAAWVGSLWVDDDKATPGTVMIAYGHTLLGDYLDEAELATALSSILSFADQLDNLLDKRLGGKRAAGQ